MGNTKLNFGNIFIFLFLILFPFGQIIRIGFVQPVDIVVGLAAAYSIYAKLKKPPVFKFFETFLIIAGFSWIFGAALFRKAEVFYGVLYLMRIAAYFYFLIYAWNFARKNKTNKKLLLDSLIAVTVISAVFGWVQYFVFPSLQAFTIWGWDDHLYRLVGTFLDPTFLGVIIVFGFIASLYRFITTKKKSAIFIAGFLLISLAFTYSRASYLALLAGLSVFGFSMKVFKKILFIIFSLILLIAVLPTSGNHVLGITRAYSAIARIDNYAGTLKLLKTSPIFGVGYDNLCLAKASEAGYINFASHACSGSDSSILFVLVTTGFTGLIVFIYLIWNIGMSVHKNPYILILGSSFAALLAHSLFSNSMVYPWVLGWMMILLALNLGSEG